ncbi:STAS domain-containing protein [Paraburkholderia sp. 22B1P]|uniref:STAS domain-containing protein n=1 Tax=Paraburkholderia sp. 22B1P TaxID=3080498 RepID=UPI00308FCC1F|nr:STAS domain-containing protein [Paraburkholderia sp. 22B1P]
MNHFTGKALAGFLNERELLDNWLDQHLSVSLRRGLATEAEKRSQFVGFMEVFLRTLRSSDTLDANRPEWEPVRVLLSEVSNQRTRQGFTPVETAAFVFSLKQPLYSQLRVGFGNDMAAMADANWSITLLLDALGLYTTEVFQRSREATIARQREELLELSTPVVELWEGILALPLVGTLDSARTQVVMENLLQRIVETGAAVAIIDITGVPTVDTLVAQHLMKTVAAARLMGTDCIISGIRPQIAQTVVHLGVDLSSITTRASVADAFIVALRIAQATGPGVRARSSKSA